MHRYDADHRGKGKGTQVVEGGKGSPTHLPVGGPRAAEELVPPLVVSATAVVAGRLPQAIHRRYDQVVGRRMAQWVLQPPTQLQQR